MIRRIANILMSVVLLITFTGLSINMHLCQDRLYDIAILSEAHSCCEDPGHDHEMFCHHQDSGNADKSQTKSGQTSSKSCKDKTVKISSPDNFIISFFDFSPDSRPVVLFNNLARPEAVPQSEKHYIAGFIPYNDISPPDTGTALSLLQSYLI